MFQSIIMKVRQFLASIFLFLNAIRIKCYEMKVVTRFDNLGGNFDSKFSDNTKLKTSYLSFSVRQKLCKQIIGTPYFMMKQEEFLDIADKSVQDNLRKYYPKIFSNLFDKREKKKSSFFLFCKLIKKKHQSVLRNRYIEHGVRIQGKIQKLKLFSCLAKQFRNNQYKEYFIGQELSVVTNVTSYSINHVYSYDQNQRLVLEALIEDAPDDHVKILETLTNQWGDCPVFETLETDVQTFYVYTKDRLYFKNQNSDRNVSVIHQRYNDNAICGRWQSESGKLRICASVMLKFANELKYQFLPTKFNVKHECKKGEIVIDDGITKLAPYSFRVTKHEEWLLGCLGYSLKTNKRVIFYVSHYNDPTYYSVFVHVRMKNQFVPCVYYSAVSPLYFLSITNETTEI